MKNIRSPQEVRNAVFLASCPVEEAIRWLRDRGTDVSTVMGTPNTRREDHLPEYILARRNDPAIDVALAEYGHSRTVLRRLYERSSGALRTILCSNASLFVGENLSSRRSYYDQESTPLMWKIVESGPLSELRAVCENPNLSSYFYSGLITAWPAEEGRAAMSEDRFQDIIEFLAGNPRVSQSREESAERHYLDGFADYEYNKFYTEAWKLADKVPATKDWAAVLAVLYRNLHKPYDVLDDVEETLKRWTPEDEGTYSPFKTLREAICRAFLKPSLDQLRHEDEARRTAFIGTFDPSSPEFRDLDWSEISEADSYWRFAAMRNMKIWASADARQKFRSQIWADSEKDSDITGIGYFNEEEERLRKLHPEWFKDEDEEFDDADSFLGPGPDPIEELRFDVRSLVAEMKAAREGYLTMAIVFIAGLAIGHWVF